MRLVKVAGGGGPWNGPVELKGCADESAGQCVVGALETDNTGYTASLGTSHSSDAYQQWNQFLSATWACDACGPGTHSTIALDNAQKITGWKRSSGGFSSAQKWHLETSMSANSGFKTVCPSTSLTNEFQPCAGLYGRFVRLVKDAGGGGPWNGKIQLEGCSSCQASSPLPRGATKVASSEGNYQQFDNFMGATWACDRCAAGAASVQKLPETRTVTGWKRDGGAGASSVSNAQKWRLEGSLTNGNFKTICASTSLTQESQACDGSQVRVRSLALTSLATSTFSSTSTYSVTQFTHSLTYTPQLVSTPLLVFANHQVNYVRLVKEAGGGGPWNQMIKLDGCSPSTKACSNAEYSSGSTVSTTNGIGTYQQWNNFLGTTWACDKCSSGTASVMKLAAPQAIKGWKRLSGGISDAQKWRLEGSMTDGNYKEICPTAVLNNAFQFCDGTTVRYVRLIKVAGGGGPWNGAIRFKTCA